LVNASDTPQKVSIILEGARKLDPKAMATVLKSADLNMFNTIEQPFSISPSDQEVVVKGKTMQPELAANSFTVIRIKQK